MLKYSTGRRRYTLVGSVAPVTDATEVFVYSGQTHRVTEWTIESDTAMRFETHKAAAEVAAALNAPYKARGRRGRFSVVPADYNTDAGRARVAASAKPRKPRKTVRPTADESARLEAHISAAYALAAGKLTLPPRSRLAVFVTEARASRGGRDNAGQYFIAIRRANLNDSRPGYAQYLVAHELAHVADVLKNGSTSHGPRFMECLRVLCPPELQAYELTYKRTQAIRAGIRISAAAPEVRASVAAHLERRKAPPQPRGMDLLSEMLGRAFNEE